MYNFIIGKTFIKTELIFGGLYRKNNHFKIAVYYRILGYLLFRTLKFHVSLCFFFFFSPFTGPPPIPAEPVVSPEPAYVSKVHYGRKVLYDVLF